MFRSCHIPSSCLQPPVPTAAITCTHCLYSHKVLTSCWSTPLLLRNACFFPWHSSESTIKDWSLLLQLQQYARLALAKAYSTPLTACTEWEVGAELDPGRGVHEQSKSACPAKATPCPSQLAVNGLCVLGDGSHELAGPYKETGPGSCGLPFRLLLI